METQIVSNKQNTNEPMILAHLTSAQDALAKASLAIQELSHQTHTKPRREKSECKMTMVERSKTFLAWQAARGVKSAIRGSQNKIR